MVRKISQKQNVNVKVHIGDIKKRRGKRVYRKRKEVEQQKKFQQQPNYAQPYHPVFIQSGKPENGNDNALLKNLIDLTKKDENGLLSQVFSSPVVKKEIKKEVLRDDGIIEAKEDEHHTSPQVSPPRKLPSPSMLTPFREVSHISPLTRKQIVLSGGYDSDQLKSKTEEDPNFGIPASSLTQWYEHPLSQEHSVAGGGRESSLRSGVVSVHLPEIQNLYPQQNEEFQESPSLAKPPPSPRFYRPRRTRGEMIEAKQMGEEDINVNGPNPNPLPPQKVRNPITGRSILVGSATWRQLRAAGKL